MSTHVLVGFDESAQATEALEHTLERYPDATLTVVHVNDPREWISDGDEEGPQFSRRAYEQVNEAAQRTMDEAREIAAEYDHDVRTEILVGGPAKQIVRFATENDVDHIVIGSHGRRGLARFLLGSVSEQIVERSPVSVTLIRSVES